MDNEFDDFPCFDFDSYQSELINSLSFDSISTDSNGSPCWLHGLSGPNFKEVIDIEDEEALARENKR